jgi:hypothetical protein
MDVLDPPRLVANKCEENKNNEGYDERTTNLCRAAKTELGSLERIEREESLGPEVPPLPEKETCKKAHGSVRAKLH